MDAYDQLERVDGPESFLKFVQLLIEDREREIGKPIDLCGRGANGWENHTIEDFLEAAAAWAKDSDFGARQGMSDESPWKRFAAFLWCGKIYE